MTAIGSYRNVVNSGEKSSNARVLCAYVREKVRQNDTAGLITLDDVNGTPVLKIDQQDGSSLYIYEYENALKEICVSEGTEIELEYGETIAPIKKFEMDLRKDNMLQVEIADDFGNDEFVKAYIRSDYKPSDEEAMDEE